MTAQDCHLLRHDLLGLRLGRISLHTTMLLIDEVDIVLCHESLSRLVLSRNWLCLLLQVSYVLLVLAQLNLGLPSDCNQVLVQAR